MGIGSRVGIVAAFALCVASCEIPPSKETQQIKEAIAGLEFEIKTLREEQKNAPSTGRFQIVNGTPSLTRNIMLLDTYTGQTWVLCGDKGISAAWCSMPTGFAQSGKMAPQ